MKKINKKALLYSISTIIGVFAISYFIATIPTLVALIIVAIMGILILYYMFSNK